MLIEHQGKRPSIHESACVAPTAVVCGDVTIGPHAQVGFGAVVVAQGGSVVIGAQSIIRENAVIRATPQHSVQIGADAFEPTVTAYEAYSAITKLCRLLGRTECDTLAKRFSQRLGRP
jgi:acyl-[acyl carrier protein]--UDP-N-acetylglucosamine O-acyltransferase